MVVPIENCRIENLGSTYSWISSLVSSSSCGGFGVSAIGSRGGCCSHLSKQNQSHTANVKRPVFMAGTSQPLSLSPVSIRPPRCAEPSA